MNQSIHLCNLGSSSSGNSTLIWQGNEALLVDIGFSQRYMTQRLDEVNVPFASLRGVLITHLHSDHITQAMLNKVLRYEIPVYIHQNLHRNFINRFRLKSQQFLRTYNNVAFQVGTFSVKGFAVPHDSQGGCYGYSIEKDEKKITIATDMGFPGNGLAETFKDSNLIVIESNHDPNLLETSGRPLELIERIKTIGHLSNEQCVTFMDDILSRSGTNPQAIVLAHLSEDCNRPRLAQKEMQTLLNKHNCRETQLQISKKNQPSSPITI